MTDKEEMAKKLFELKELVNQIEDEGEDADLKRDLKSLIADIEEALYKDAPEF